MAATAGIIVALVGLAIVIVAFVSFVYPLPGLTTKRGRGWTVVVGYGVLLWGSTIIRQTVPEELRESFITIPMLVIFGAFVLSCIALIRPLPSFWLPTRKKARYACSLSLGLMVAVSPLLPEPPPPTPEELAAIAAEEKREAEEAEVRRKAEEAEAEAKQESDEFNTMLREGYEEVEARRIAIEEWGEEHQYDAEDHCAEKIEELAPYIFRWTTDWVDRRMFYTWLAIDPKKGNLSFFPEITEKTLLAYTGNKIRFAAKDGEFRKYQYQCIYHPDSETVIHVSASPESNQ